MCKPKQPILCGSKECDICYPRSLQKYLEERNIVHCFIQCIDNPELQLCNLTHMSNKKCKFICKNHSCDRIYECTCDNFTKRKGCAKCSNRQKKTTEQFIEDAKKKHGNKYTYEKTNYIGAEHKVIITCPKHGDFDQIARDHLSNHGCPQCGIESMIAHNKYTTEIFIEKATFVHGDKYDYSKVEYIDSRTNVTIGCPNGHFFEQKPVHHLSGRNCHICYGTHIKTTEQFIIDAKNIHGDKYDYSKVKYITAKDKVEIICPLHIPFYQTPNDHLTGYSCPFCKNKTEGKLLVYLKSIYSDTISQYQPKFIGKKRYDFFIPSINTIIELDGNHHFKQVSNWESYINNQYKDIYKMILANINGISIIRVYQPDITNDIINWKELLSIALTKVQKDKPTNTYIASNNHIYDSHKYLYLSGLNIYNYTNNIKTDGSIKLYTNSI